MKTPELGILIEGAAFRDAVHVAIAPVEAAHSLESGDHVGIGVDGRAWTAGVDYIGIVDPYLRRTVQEGERFWLCLYPGTVTSLRHAFTHPAFRPSPPEAADA